MRIITKKIPMLFLAFVFAFGLMAVTASAAKKIPVKKLKNQGFTTTKSVANKKAVSVKKGTYTIKMGTKSSGYLKFKAPKTKSYKFTFSKLKTNTSYTCGHAYIMTDSKYGNGYITYATMKTQGGSNSVLWLATKNSSTSVHKKDRFLASRYGTIKLTKGQVVYIYLNIVNPKTSLRLNIK